MPGKKKKKKHGYKHIFIQDFSIYQVEQKYALRNYENLL